MKNERSQPELELVSIPYNLGVELASALRCEELAVLLGLTHLALQTGSNTVELTEEVMERLGQPDPTAKMEFVRIPYQAMLDISRGTKDGIWAVLAKLLKLSEQQRAIEIDSPDWSKDLGLNLKKLFPILKRLRELQLIEVKPPTLQRGPQITVSPAWIPPKD
jgi:hypothetical protein